MFDTLYSKTPTTLDLVCVRGSVDESDEMKEEYERLTHPPAEAQIDFGITEAIEDGK